MTPLFSRLILPLLTILVINTDSRLPLATGFVVGSTFRRARRMSFSPLWNGFGIATDYSWKEEAFEIDITVAVPPDTLAKDVLFKAKQTSIDLKLKGGGEDVTLLDGNRTMRGKVSLDGTYWVISDDEEITNKREITVTVEKSMRTPKDDFEVIDYDWKGVYPDDEEEVLERKYEEPEELDVRDYAASLGVDIDNINMSMVDKSMFTSGLNMTRSTFDELRKAGYVKEVTQQEDGREYVTNEDGEAMPFSKLGQGIGEDEIRDAADGTEIPFLDTSSPWNKPLHDLEIGVSDTKGTATEKVAKEEKTQQRQQPLDPIDRLTVQRLKAVLREQGLKVSGNKQELRERLRAHVQRMVEHESAEKEND